MPRRLEVSDPALVFAGGGVVVVAVAWATGTPEVAAVGALVALTALLLSCWGRWSLAGVRYSRTLGQRRALFGEHVTMEVELVNDKLLPLTWVHVEEEVPPHLPIEGGTVGAEGWRTELRFVVPMRPYQRVRRRLTVVAAQRGEHTFGPTTIRSGSPLGTHERSVEIRNQTSLLVYPKVFALSAPLVPSSVPIGEHRARRSLAVDPTRVLGVRPYQTGDPTRHIDWRATARSADLLVRVHEPATSLGTAVFVDLAPPPNSKLREATDIVELTVAVAASVVSHLLADGIPTGLYLNGTAFGRLVASPPSSSAQALPALLDTLARVTGFGGGPIDAVLARQQSRLRAGVSVLVVSAHFPAATVVAVAGTRRPTSAMWIATERGAPPPTGLFDHRWEVPYGDDWRDRTVLDLGS
ncbi:MAG: DUF58 domain-containing protein [Acidimicrobiales bacterium]